MLATRTLPRRRPQQVTFAGLLLGAASLGVLQASPVLAAELGPVNMTPASGTNATVFALTLEANCPAGTVEAYFQIDGPDLPVGTLLGPAATPQGVGPQRVEYAIANIKTTNAGSFASDGTYNLSFNCADLFNVITDQYTSTFSYTAAGAGAYTFNAPVVTPPPTTPAPTTPAPTTPAPTTPAPTTPAPTTPAPTTPAPTTPAPTEPAPTSAAPTSAAPTSASPTSTSGTGVLGGTGSQGGGTGGTGSTSAGGGRSLPVTGLGLAGLVSLAAGLVAGGVTLMRLGRDRELTGRDAA